LEVVGVVQDARTAPDEQPPLTIYIPYWEWPPWQASLVIRTVADPRSVALGVQRIIRQIDSSIAIPSPATMHEVLSQSVAPRRFATLLGMIFALSATFLAALGLYGLISLAGSQRIREIGIRIALGAETSRIFWMMISQAVAIAAVGLLVGAAAAFAATRMLAAFLYEVKPGDPLTFCAVCGGLLAISFVASYVPARRATRVDPIVALRYE
jgi:putative ABC transport system permease protein